LCGVVNRRLTACKSEICNVGSTAVQCLLRENSREKHRSERCVRSPTPRDCRCISRQTTFSCFFQHIQTIPQARLPEKSRASQPDRCGSNTNTSWKSTCGVADSGKNHTTSERVVKYRARRLSSISNALNTSPGAYGIHPRGHINIKAPRYSACFLCRIRRLSLDKAHI
jgi:hypothetical protein